MGIPLAEPNISQIEKDFVLDALDSGWINTSGPYVKQLQDLIAKRIGARRAVAVANGTSGLFLALKALGVGPGDKVLVPTITFIASINAIIHVGAEPVFFDCDEYLNIKVEDLKAYLETRPSNIKAIMPVHIFGNPCDMTAINTLAREHNLVVVEDACEAIGSVSNEGYCGVSGDIGVFSFSFNKMITSGNGGAVITNRNQIADKIKYWITQSKDDPFNYIHNEVGYNLGLTNLHAALGAAQLTRLGEFLMKKTEVAYRYADMINEERLFLRPSYASRSNFWFIGYDSDHKETLLKRLKDNQIEARPLWLPNHLQIPFSEFECFGEMTNAMHYSKRVVNLPCSTTLTPKQIEKVCDIIKSIE
jgi:perosamine synthetase